MICTVPPPGTATGGLVPPSAPHQAFDSAADKAHVCGHEETGAVCFVSFTNKRARDTHLRVVRGMVSRTGLAVVTNECPWCRTFFRAKLTAQRHASTAFENGTCFADLTLKPHTAIVRDSFVCSFCEFQADDLDSRQRHIVAQHAPRRRPSALHLPLPPPQMAMSRPAWLHHPRPSP